MVDKEFDEAMKRIEKQDALVDRIEAEDDIALDPVPGEAGGPLAPSERDFRREFTTSELRAVIDRLFCLYTREPRQEFKHSTEEILAVIQQAKHASYYQEKWEASRRDLARIRAATIEECAVIALGAGSWVDDPTGSYEPELPKCGHDLTGERNNAANDIARAIRALAVPQERSKGDG